MSDPKVDLIASVSLFKGLGRKELEQIAQLVDEVDVPAGQVLMRQGETGHEMFIVADGKVGIDRDGKRIAERGPGSSIGEISLLSKGPRTATVTVLEPSRLLVAAQREFHALMDDHPTIRMGVLDGIADKLRSLDKAGFH